MREKVFNTYRQIDPIFLGLLLSIVFVGLFTLQTASIARSNLLYDSSYWFFLRQFMLGVVPGLTVFTIIQFIPYPWIKRFSFVFFLFAIILNVSILIPGLGITQKGATRWIDLGIITVQPSEVMKLALVVYLSMVVSKLREDINKVNSMIAFVVIVGISAGIVGVLQSNLSTALLLVAISGAILFVSRVKKRWLFLLGGLGMVMAVSAVVFVPYRMQRVQTFLSGEERDIFGEGYQVQQNLIAVGSGGLFGVGVGQSRQKFNYIPEATSDSIFAVYAEEVGFIGVVVFVALSSMLILRSLYWARVIQDEYGKFIIVGVITWFSMQLFLNVGATISVIPLTGVPLPFVSYGSSSLIVLFAAFGLIANITRFAPRRAS
jgi:cell division protein FtsW